MNPQTLTLLCKLRNLSQADVARLAGVSRQAVSLWVQKGQSTPMTPINIQSRHLQSLAAALQIPVDTLLSPLPCLESPSQHQPLNTALNWDHLFPSFEDFAIALSQKKLRAVARLVQVFGLFVSEKIVGKIVWSQFYKYKKHMLPVRQRECEKIWKLQKNLKLA